MYRPYVITHIKRGTIAGRMLAFRREEKGKNMNIKTFFFCPESETMVSPLYVNNLKSGQE